MRQRFIWYFIASVVSVIFDLLQAIIVNACYITMIIFIGNHPVGTPNPKTPKTDPLIAMRFSRMGWTLFIGLL